MMKMMTKIFNTWKIWLNGDVDFNNILTCNDGDDNNEHWLRAKSCSASIQHVIWLMKNIESWELYRNIFDEKKKMVNPEANARHALDA